MVRARIAEWLGYMYRGRGAGYFNVGALAPASMVPNSRWYLVPCGSARKSGGGKGVSLGQSGEKVPYRADLVRYAVLGGTKTRSCLKWMGAMEAGSGCDDTNTSSHLRESDSMRPAPVIR